MKPTTFIFICLLSNAALHANAATICNPDHIAATSPSSKYQVNPDRTVTDITTGLEWKQCVEGLSGNQCEKGQPTLFTWQAALLYPKTFNKQSSVGKTDWRIPNVRELGTLVELRCMNPSINTAIFANTPSLPLWTSSPYSAGPDFYSWVVDFGNGAIFSDDRTKPKPLRLVRTSTAK